MIRLIYIRLVIGRSVLPLLRKLCTVTLLSASTTVHARQAPPETVSSVLSASILKLVNRGEAANDVRLHGTVTYIPGSKQETGTITLISKADGTARIDVSVPSGKHSVLRFPRSSASQSVVSEPEGTRGIQRQDLLVAGNWFFPEHLLNVLNASDHENVIADQALCSPELICVTSRLATSTPAARQYTGRLSEMTVSLDAATLLPTRLDYAVYPTTQVVTKVLIQVQYSDYQTIEGHYIPLHLQEFVNGALHLDIHIASEDLHANLAPSELNGDNQ